jgi:hypothetical protein
MIKYYLTFIFLCVAFILSNRAQNGNIFLTKADSNFKILDFEMAQLYYSRAAFDENNPNIQATILFKKAESLLLLNKIKQAFNVCQSISLTELNDSMRAEVLYKNALYAFLAEDYFEAKSKLLLLEEIYLNKKSEAKTKILNVLILNEEGKYAEARTKLLNYISEDKNLSEDQKLYSLRNADSIYQVNKVPKLKNEKRAITLNSGTLGFGYFYGGYIAEGISSFIFQTAGLGLSALAIYNGYYATGLIAPFTIYNYFHVGSIKRIEYLIERDNYKKKRKFNQSIKAAIIHVLQ